eukprot:CCRYP_013685-RA/>CCRYP_013685-RA protein AED:0.41 eAED:0.41 QI:0/0/0/1/1/1/2/0/261
MPFGFRCENGFHTEAPFIAGGHMTETPTALTYSSVVVQDSVRLAFFIATLNDIDVNSCDIRNAYLHAPCREKVWFKAGIECGEHSGKVMKVVRALYGLKSAGASRRLMFSNFIINQLGFTPTWVDSDVYCRKAMKDDGTYYYELICLEHVQRSHKNWRVVFDPALPDFDESHFRTNADWTESYHNAVEEDPPGMPEPLGRQAVISAFVDADHAGNKVTRHSHTGVLVVNNALITTFSKRQNTVESSAFGSELVAMRIVATS